MNATRAKFQQNQNKGSPNIFTNNFVKASPGGLNKTFYNTKQNPVIIGQNLNSYNKRA